MQDDDHAHRVSEALAYLVRRMESFCSVSGTDVLMYKPRDRSRIPERMPAAEVLHGQARNYSRHRELYPEDHHGRLAAHVRQAPGDQQGADPRSRRKTPRPLDPWTSAENSVVSVTGSPSTTSSSFQIWCPASQPPAG